MSTTDPRRQQGQILVIFAFSLLVIFGVAALAFDAGLMFFERRTEQNAADAAALAGARYLPSNSADAVADAVEMATKNGYTDGSGDETVAVNVPPTTGPHAGNSGFIEVLIGNTRPSFFAGIWGIFTHEVGARSVAANEDGPLGPFGMLSLNPHDCAAVDIKGGGVLNSNGDIQVDSDCPNGALSLSGSGTIVVAGSVGCDIVGDFKSGGASSYNCAVTEGVQSIPDPFSGLPEPPIPMTGTPPSIVYPTPPHQELGGAKAIPGGCPGSASPATDAAPKVCKFSSSYDGTTWRMYPGYYPGGIQLLGGSFYFEPGIYYVTGDSPLTAGGGFKLAGGTVTATSVDAGGTSVGGGMMIYNGDHPGVLSGFIDLTGGGTGVRLRPLADGSVWNGLVIFQDRAVCNEVTLNGGHTILEVRGAVYVPCGQVKANGNGGTITLDQIVADTFQFNGNGGTMNVAYDQSFVPRLTLAGLVE